MSARKAKAARRAARCGPAVPDAPAAWDGAVPREAIAAVVQEVVTAEGRRVYGLVPEQMCLHFATVGAMMARLATGRRYALQIGGFAVHGLGGELLHSYGPGWGTEVRDRMFHSWFTAVPAGVSCEAAWACPPWAEVCDLTLRYFTETDKAARHGGRPPLPPWFWGSRTAMRDSTGVVYKPDRGVTMGVLAGTFAPGCDDHRWFAYACRTAAALLGLRMEGMVPLVPGSFLVGHRVPAGALQLRG